jgi:radical SAM superfamily enzyme YgiQ (UPF0313 family)
MISRELIKKADLLLNKEQGSVFKDPGGRINICLVYPNTYYVGMSNLGFQGIYSILNERGDTLCERAFLPDEDDMAEFYRTGSELFSLETKRPLNRFDIVAFSVSFENDFLSIPVILRLARIGVFRSQRSDRDPLLLLGGVCATSNPEPISDFFDIVFIGEAEDAINDLIESCKKHTGDRSQLLGTLSEKEGFYIPSLYRVRYSEEGLVTGRERVDNAPEIITKRTVSTLDGRLKQAIITPSTEFPDMCLIEAMRGCVWNCRFCLAGHIYNPPRHKDIGVLSKEIASAKARSGRVGLIGPSLTDYRYVREALSIEGVDFSVTSLRATSRARDLIALIKRQKSASIAPEAGTDRLRMIINKRITEEDILETSEMILKEGVQTLRLYFMLGLPFERDEDIEGIIDLAKKIGSFTGRASVVLSISTFVPKPSTPFQWHPMTDEKTIKARLKRIKSSLKREGIRVFHDIVKYAHLQGLFSMGDRRLSGFISGMEEAGRWRMSLEDSGLSSGFYLFRKRDFSEILPWDFIDTGISKSSLWEEYKRAEELSRLD